MVAIIKASASLRNVLHYNENKLKQNVARLIHAHGFGKDTENLGFNDKLRTFEKLNALNERTKLKTVHISLNFDLSEKLSQATLSKIAESYMQKIGFGGQPFLVYEHYDAAHPHLHLISTTIQRDGRRIQMRNIGRNQSEKARKEIEKEFKLKQAQGQKQIYELKPVNAQKIQYGKSETKRAITNVLDRILPAYKYSSLPELNAILKGYNIVADRGSENSRTYKAGGLVYRVLDEKGRKIGAPVKASAIYNRPTLKFLERRFQQNFSEKQRHKLRLKNAIDYSFIKRPCQSLKELIYTLSKERIQVVLRQNEKGIIYGVTYVDHETKCVFNGSDLGKQYSANQLQERLNNETLLTQQQSLKQDNELTPGSTIQQQEKIASDSSPADELWKELTANEREQTLATEFRRQQFKKRKRKRLHQ
jgi:hypothetical protein